MTPKEYKALKLFSEGREYTANAFAKKYFDTDEHRYLLTAESKTGGGYDTVIGKKAWLCAGSILAKLKKKGWLSTNLKTFTGPKGGRYCYTVYRLTERGKNELENQSTHA